MYITILICIAIIIISFGAFALLMQKKIAKQYIVKSCMVTLIIEMLLVALWPIPSFCFDEIRLGGGQEVFIKYVSIHNVPIDFPDVVEGEWLWLNGMYGWQKDKDITDSITLEIPVGTVRKIVFQGQNSGGSVNIISEGFVEEVDLYSENGSDISIELPDSTQNLILKNELIRILIFSIIHFSILCVCFFAIKLFLVNIMQMVDKFKYEIAIFFASLFVIIRYGYYNGLFAYPSTFYFKGYEFGFVKRGLVGWICNNISPYVSAENLANFKLCFIILLYFLLSIAVGFFVRKQKDERIRWFICLLIVSLPSTYIFVATDLYLDIYVLIIFAVSVFLIAKDCIVWCVPILAFNMLLINETSCTYFLCPLCAILLYKFMKYRQKKYLFSLIGSIFGALLVCLMFIFRTDPWLNFNFSQILEHLQNHAGFTLNVLSLSAETYSLKRQFDGISEHIIRNNGCYIFFLLLVLPILSFLSSFYHKLINKVKKDKSDTGFLSKVLPYILIYSNCFGFVPMIFAWDYPRYISFILNAIIITIFFFIHEEKIQLSYDDLVCCENGSVKSIIPIAICVFYLMFGMFAAAHNDILVVRKFSNFFSLLFN